jgi:hypothetical protein
MVKRALLLPLSFALLLILTSTFVQAQAQPVVSAPFVTVGVGDTFTIPVRITGATALTSWQFDLAFDPTLVRANSVIEGPFLSSSGAQSTLFVPGFIDNGGGHILGVNDLFIDISPPPSGDGVLANIEFTALAPGVSPLTFSNVFLNLSDQGFSTVNGQITVTVTLANTAIPTLTEWGLMALILLIGIVSIYFLKRPSIMMVS